MDTKSTVVSRERAPALYYVIVCYQLVASLLSVQSG